MGIRGDVTLECDQPKCHAEIVLSPVDFDICNWTPPHTGVAFEMYAAGWLVRDGKLMRPQLTCPQCAAEEDKS